MSQATIIDTKSETHNYDLVFTHESVTTTLSISYTGDDNFGIIYNSEFSGIKNGHVQGGPIPVSQNTQIKVHDNPDVIVTITQFNLDLQNHHISLHIRIDVDIPVIGKKNIFDQTLGGYYNPSVFGWKAIISEFKTKS
ncbi:hypothetical protein [Clostridium cellulovorans]|uniref:Uncharacterized protein n=1 Tax=Clostridium cellulovorans (strain ATCC 35296 / DSM 3052 / OCM 3 / 743B) TaxID=573061 RepID=D9ST98_CLOC7|nr:hypothetical protein [Clostridium cellulovorans]ADL50714.1 hypothetical protein Clocel_0946 [Clostridium cellulovorans 743B]